MTLRIRVLCERITLPALAGLALIWFGVTGKRHIG
jgi:hypothetical protein